MAEKTKGKKKLLSSRGLVREFSAGGVVVKKENGENLFLLIKPSGTDRWQLPKGRIDEGESSENTAVREVEEEGGVKVRIIKKIGNQQYFFFFNRERILKNVTFYLMEYISDNPKGHDKEVEEITFLPFNGAYERLTFRNDKEMLEKAKEILSGNCGFRYVEMTVPKNKYKSSMI